MMDRAVSKEFKQFGKMTPEVRRDVIFKDASWEAMSQEDLEKFKKKHLVECLITYKKGAEKQVLAYLTSRGVNTDDIVKAGANQIVLRGTQESMQHLAGVLYVNAPDLITKPVNPYLTNSGNFGDVKLSPKGVPFGAVLDATANLVEDAFIRKPKGLTLEHFAEFVHDKRLGMLTSGANLCETAVLSDIEHNIEDKIGHEKFRQKIDKLTKSDKMSGKFLKDGGVQV